MGEAEPERADQPEDAPAETESGPVEKGDKSAGKKKSRKSKEVRISEKELNDLKEKASLADEYWDRLLRLQADFENFRKRKEKERLDLIKYATEALICELIPVLGNFETALLASENVPQVKGFIEGIELILKELKKISYK